MGISITVTKLEPRMSGEEVRLFVNIKTEKHEDTVNFTVSSKMLFDIGNIGMGSIPYELTEAQFDSLEYSSKLWEAVKKGIDIISYGDNTKSKLILKLRGRGFDRDISEDAADYLAEMGYIDEKRMLERAVHQLADVKLYGKSRIKSELYKKGISREVMDEYLDELLEEVDFEANLCALVKKRCDFDMLYDCKYRESLYASMYRYGYSPSETRAAVKAVLEEQ